MVVKNRRDRSEWDNSRYYIRIESETKGTTHGIKITELNDSQFILGATHKDFTDIPIISPKLSLLQSHPLSA